MHSLPEHVSRQPALQQEKSNGSLFTSGELTEGYPFDRRERDALDRLDSAREEQDHEEPHS